MDRILIKGLQAMLNTMQEELGKLLNQMLQDAISPEMLADMLGPEKGLLGVSTPDSDFAQSESELSTTEAI